MGAGARRAGRVGVGAMTRRASGWLGYASAACFFIPPAAVGALLALTLVEGLLVLAGLDGPARDAAGLATAARDTLVPVVQAALIAGFGLGTVAAVARGISAA